MSSSKFEGKKNNTTKEQVPEQCSGVFGSAGSVTFEHELKSKVSSGKTTDSTSLDCLRQLRKQGITPEGKKVLESFSGTHGCQTLGMDPIMAMIAPETDDASVELLATLQACCPNGPSTKSFIGCMLNSHDPYTVAQALVAKLESDPRATDVRVQCESKMKNPRYTEAVLVGLRESEVSEVRHYGEVLSQHLKQEGNVFAKYVVDVLYGLPD